MEDLADKYVTHAGNESGTAKMNLMVRACHWYERARFGQGQDHGDALLRRIHDFEKNLPPARPVILHAKYGGAQGCLDVTEKLRLRLVQHPANTWPLHLPVAEFGNDPAPGQDKALFVAYRYKGSVYLGIDPLLPDGTGRLSTSVSFVLYFPQLPLC